MSVDKQALKEVLDLAKSAEKLSPSEEIKPAVPVGLDDNLKDLPKYLQPAYAEHKKLVQNAIAFICDTPSHCELREYYPICQVLSKEDKRNNDDTREGIYKISLDDPKVTALNFRDMLEHLIASHPAKHPECVRVTVDREGHWHRPTIQVWTTDVYPGTDKTMARGIVLLHKKLRVLDPGVYQYLGNSGEIGIERNFSNLFVCRSKKVPTSEEREKELKKSRILKGQLSADSVRNMLHCIVRTLHCKFAKYGFYVNRPMNSCKHFAEYTAFLIEAYPLYVEIIPYKERVTFHNMLLDTAPYIPGLRKHGGRGRKELADFLAKTLRKEKLHGCKLGR
jgi:hypothetical protein